MMLSIFAALNSTILIPPILICSSPLRQNSPPLIFSAFFESLLPLPSRTPLTDYLCHVLTSFFITNAPHDQFLSELSSDPRRFVETLISSGDVIWESPGFDVPSSDHVPGKLDNTARKYKPLPMKTCSETPSLSSVHKPPQ